MKICCLRHWKILNKITLKNTKQLHPKTYRYQFGHWVQHTSFWSPAHEKYVEHLVFLYSWKTFSSYAQWLITIYFLIMLFMVLKIIINMTRNNPKKIHPKNIPLQIQSLGTRDFFLVACTRKIVENLVFFDTAEKRSVVMHHG